MHQDQPGLVVGARRNSPARDRPRRRRELPRLRRRRVRRVHPPRPRDRPGPDRHDHPRPGRPSPTSTATPVEVEEFEVAWDASAADKGGWSSFMAKEITEEPDAVANTLRGRIARRRRSSSPSSTAFGDDVLAGIHRIVIIACGTAAYAGQAGKYAIEKWARRSRRRRAQPRVPLPRPGDRPTTPSSSRSASPARPWTRSWPSSTPARPARRRISICNTQGATIPRESDAVVYTHAGPEVAVASTKAFVAQITALYLFGLHLARVRGTPDARPSWPSRSPSSQAIPDKIATTLLEAAPTHRAARALDGRHPRRCSSSAATSATRSRSRVRSSSRSSPTSTPRASPPASSSTARSR